MGVEPDDGEGQGVEMVRASEPSLPLTLLDKALALQAPLTERHIARLRRNRPDATPHEIVRRLNRELRAATISSGIGVGAAAAAPGVGTGVALPSRALRRSRSSTPPSSTSWPEAKCRASASMTSSVAERWSWP